MAQSRVAHTADLDAATLRAARALLDEVFAGELTEQDWEHSLGGIHALLWDGAELIGHASLIQRRLLHAGRALRAGYVEGLGVHPARRGRGHGATSMAALERIVRGAHELGALSATEQAAGFYAARGWLVWQGRSCALTPTGVIRTPDDDDGIYVQPCYVQPCPVSLDVTGELTCDWREGDLMVTTKSENFSDNCEGLERLGKIAASWAGPAGLDGEYRPKATAASFKVTVSGTRSGALLHSRD